MVDFDKQFDYMQSLEKPDYNLPRPKLSELIRQGATYYPQAFGYWWFRGDVVNFKYDNNAPIERTCALGAAATAIGYTSECHQATGALINVLGWHWGQLPYVMYPEDASCWRFSDRTKPMDILGVVAGLNDDARWTREQIADWLESIGY